jgi:asparagine synthase (glutamine-hydrolysing)
MPRGEGYFNLRRRVERFCEGSGLSVEDRYRRWISIFPDEELLRILHPDLKGGVDSADVHRAFEGVLAGNKQKPLLDRLLEVNFATYLPDDLLVKVDRASMANSLEARSPMLDKDLAAYLSTLPADWKLRGNQLKFILRKAFADLIPEEILSRPKHGFGVPVGRWFRTELEPMYRELVLAGDARCREYVDPAGAERVLSEHLSGNHQHGHRLWVLLNLEVWLRLLTRPVTMSPPSAQMEVEARS